MDSHIFQVLSLLCLRTSLEVHAGIGPGVHVGTLTGFERGTNPGWKTGGKREVSLGPGLSNQNCTHSLPRSWVEGSVVQLCEAWGFMDQG